MMGFVVLTELRSVEEAFTEVPVIEDYWDEVPAADAEPEPEEYDEQDYFYPVGTLHRETPQRQDYADGDLHLYIPRLELEVPIYNGVDDETLKKGVGLFDEAQLPQGFDINSNTVLAGHRDVHGEEFYYIDTVEIGDRIYLTYEGDLYTYEVIDQFFTDAMDWSPVEVKEFACVTLQSCHPIGIATDRIFTVGRLIDITPDAGFPDEDQLAGEAADQGDLMLEPDAEPTAT